MSASWRRVAAVPLGIPGTYFSIVSSSDTLPSWYSWSSTVAVTVLVKLPTRVWSEGVGAPAWPAPTVPDAPIHVPLGDHTPAMTPGKPAWARVSSSACWKPWTVSASNAPAAAAVVAAVVADAAVVVGGDWVDVATSSWSEPHAARSEAPARTNPAVAVARDRCVAPWRLIWLVWVAIRCLSQSVVLRASSTAAGHDRLSAFDERLSRALIGGCQKAFCIAATTSAWSFVTVRNCSKESNGMLSIAIITTNCRPLSPCT